MTQQLRRLGPSLLMLVGSIALAAPQAPAPIQSPVQSPEKQVQAPAPIQAKPVQGPIQGPQKIAPVQAPVKQYTPIQGPSEKQVAIQAPSEKQCGYTGCGTCEKRHCGLFFRRCKPVKECAPYEVSCRPKRVRHCKTCCNGGYVAAY